MAEEVFQAMKEAVATKSSQQKNTSTSSGSWEEPLEKAIAAYEKEDYRSATDHLKEATKQIDCQPCQRKLTSLAVDVMHMSSICSLGDERCNDLKEKNKRKLHFYKDVFIPKATELKEASKKEEKE